MKHQRRPPKEQNEQGISLSGGKHRKGSASGPEDKLHTLDLGDLDREVLPMVLQPSETRKEKSAENELQALQEQEGLEESSTSTTPTQVERETNQEVFSKIAGGVEAILMVNDADKGEQTKWDDKSTELNY
jgi:hypothetical protein